MKPGPELKEINFFDKNIGPGNVNQIINAISSHIKVNPSCQLIVELSENPLTDEGLTALLPTFLSDQITELRLDNTQLTAQGLSALFKCLKNRVVPLQALSLAENPLGDQGVVELALFLKNYPLVALSVSNCGIRPAGFRLLAPHIASHPSLITLRLSQNHIGEAITDIAAMLKANQHLKNLALDFTQLEEVPNFHEHLADALAAHPSLEALNLSGNGDDILPYTDSFYHSIVRNTSLTTYYGPDVATPEQKDFRVIQAVCDRNTWLKLCKKDTITEAHELIKQSLSTPSASLLLLCAQRLARQHQLTTEGGVKMQLEPNAAPTASNLAETIMDRAFGEACEVSIETRKLATKKML